MRIIVTGGNSGIGKATAGALAAAGHSVMIACRTIPKAEQAAAELAGNVEVRHLDLADLSSVRRFTDSVETVDVLVNNAGVMSQTLPRTADGFEPHIGTNYLGHFALTCLLGNKIKDRVISVGSASYMFGRIRLDDLNGQARKRSMLPAYADSKLAIMLFVHELVRRGVRAYVADPGGADTDITRDSTGYVGLVGRTQCVSFSRTGPSRRGPNHHSGGDHRLAERNVYRAALPQTSGHTQGHKTRKEGSRSGHGPSAMGAIRRADGLRLDGASDRADSELEQGRALWT
jgi:NAD(P)-dependent dehydrogenase (short-subunit alcohol dehydrogenase family)